MTSLPRADGFDWKNLAARVVSAAILGSIALWALLAFDRGGFWRLPWIALVCAVGGWLCVEWARMVSRPSARRTALVSAAAVIAVILLAFARRYGLAWGLMALGALGAAAANVGSARRAMDAAYGVLYIAPAGLVIAWLRESAQGDGWVLILFAATWSADICAFLAGSALRGPKLWPRFSPNKTWAGFVAGLAGAMIGSVAIAARFMRLSLAGAALIGLAAGLATMAGDLWESILKRRFGVKDSGDLIPGHGGLLDRVDGLMFAIVAVAAARLWVKLVWAH